MNITDVAEPPALDSWYGMLEAMFKRQRELMAGYQVIEKLPEPPVSLHHHSGQRIIKDFAWRAAEELAESFEALIHKHPGDEKLAREHALEELADATHFILELFIYAGVTPQQCFDYLERPWTNPIPDVNYWKLVYELGVSMNFLRNKGWKQSQVATDEARFRAALLKVYGAWRTLWFSLGQDEESIYSYYMRKSEVNLFRQRSKY